MKKLLKLGIAALGAAGAIAAASVAVWSSLPDSAEQVEVNKSRSYQAYLASREAEARNQEAQTADLIALRSRTYFEGDADPESDRATALLRALGEPSLWPETPGTGGSFRLLWLAESGESACLRVAPIDGGRWAYLLARTEPGLPSTRGPRQARRRSGVLRDSTRRDAERRLAAASLDRLPPRVDLPGSGRGTLIAESNVGGRYACVRRPVPVEPGLRPLFDLLAEIGGVDIEADRSRSPAAAPPR